MTKEGDKLLSIGSRSTPAPLFVTYKANNNCLSPLANRLSFKLYPGTGNSKQRRVCKLESFHLTHNLRGYVVEGRNRV